MNGWVVRGSGHAETSSQIQTHLEAVKGEMEEEVDDRDEGDEGVPHHRLKGPDGVRLLSWPTQKRATLSEPRTPCNCANDTRTPPETYVQPGVVPTLGGGQGLGEER